MRARSPTPPRPGGEIMPRSITNGAVILRSTNAGNTFQRPSISPGSSVPVPVRAKRFRASRRLARRAAVRTYRPSSSLRITLERGLLPAGFEQSPPIGVTSGGTRCGTIPRRSAPVPDPGTARLSRRVETADYRAAGRSGRDPVAARRAGSPKGAGRRRPPRTGLRLGVA